MGSTEVASLANDYSDRHRGLNARDATVAVGAQSLTTTPDFELLQRQDTAHEGSGEIIELAAAEKSATSIGEVLSVALA